MLQVAKARGHRPKPGIGEFIPSGFELHRPLALRRCVAIGDVRHN
jgi:hypothetical protein